jgi:hypothetical protein
MISWFLVGPNYHEKLSPSELIDWDLDDLDDLRQILVSHISNIGYIVMYNI